MKFEYIQFEWEWEDLRDLNRLSHTGWRVIYTMEVTKWKNISLLEREIPVKE